MPGSSLVGYVPALPARFVARADVFDGVRDGVLSHASVALVGMGGAGKTILATAVARDTAVQAAFGAGVVWVEAGPQATPIGLGEQVVGRLTGAPVSFPTVADGRHRLAKLIAGRAVLLVVDDVWDAQVLTAVNVVEARRGGLLFTTRDAAIARATGATIHEVDQLSLQQALTLLAHWTNTDVKQLPGVADTLCLRVGCLALGVALVGGMISARGAHPQAWAQVTTLLDGADITEIAETYGPDGYQYASVLASVTVSIDDLPPVDRDRYLELAVFAGRGSFPPAAAGALWAPAGLRREATGALLTRLTDRSLAQRDDRGWLRLHDLQYDVAAHQLDAVGVGGLTLAHGHLVDGYRDPQPDTPNPDTPNPVTLGGARRRRPGRAVSVWAQGPDDGYYFQNLAFHLAAAARVRQLHALLVSFGWLERRLAVAGISDLLGDYQHHPRPVAVEAVHAALQLSAHVLARDPGLLAGQLVGRLLGRAEPTVRALRDTARPSDGRPWLRPATPGCLTEPGGPLGGWCRTTAFGGHAQTRQIAWRGDGHTSLRTDRWTKSGRRETAVMHCPMSAPRKTPPT